MNTTDKLPENYSEIYRLDLMNDKKTALIVNGLALLITVPLAVLGQLAVPISSLFSFDTGTVSYFAKFASLLIGMIAYIILHELIHGIFMKKYSGVKPSYGFTGLYAYAGSTAFFNKKHYIIIALAPVVFWGLVLLGLCFIVPKDWFWVVYFIQIMNLSGAAGDIFVTCKFAKLPKDILVNDTGTAMTVYSDQL